MDRNSVTGLVLIGLILTVFSIMNQPSADDYKNFIKKIHYRPGWPELYMLSIEDNPIDQYASIDAISEFP
jgi:hypothetical protein